MTRAVAALSLAFSVVYLVWRWGWTLNTEALWFSVPLALAETYGLLTACFFALGAWRLSDRTSPAPLRDRTVDVFVTTYDEPIDIVRKTALAAREIRYPHATYILDDGRRDEVRHLAELLGVGYLTRPTNEHAKAGNLNNALRLTQGEFILQLDADHVPLPTMVDRLLGFFGDERVAFVQSPQDFYNTDAFTYEVDERGRRIWEDQQLFFRVLQRGKDRLNAAFFVGSCAMLRRAAIEEIGGFATHTITEDIETSLLLHARGWRSVYHNETLAYGLAPSTALAFHVQHLRWGQGAMQTLRRYRPLRLPGLSLAQRLGYLDSLTTYLGGFQRLILYLAPIVFFLTGVFPLEADIWAFLLLFLPYLALQFVSFKLLARGHGSLLLADRFAMAKFFTHIMAITGYTTRRRLGFRVTPKSGGRVPARIFAPQLGLVALTLGALAYAVWERTLGVAPDEVAGWGAAAFWVNAAYALWNAGVAASIVRASLAGQHRRAEYRFTEALAVTLRAFRVDGRAASYDIAITDDLNPRGAALRGMHPMDNGTRVELTLPLQTREVTVRGRVVRRTEHATPYGVVHVHGVEFAELEHEVREAIELHCAQHSAPMDRQRYQEGVATMRGPIDRFRELRSQPRLAVGMPVRVAAGRDATSRSLGIGLLEEVSPSGARLLLDHPVAAGSILALDVPGTQFTTRGRVVFVRALETSVGARFVVGLDTAQPGARPMSADSTWLDAMLATASRYRSAMFGSRTPTEAASRALVEALPHTVELAPAAVVDESGTPDSLVAIGAPPVDDTPDASLPVETRQSALDAVETLEAPEPEASSPPVVPFEAEPVAQADGAPIELQEPAPEAALAAAAPPMSLSNDPIPNGESAMQIAQTPSTTTQPQAAPNAAPTLLAIRGSAARLEGKFDIEDSIEVQCELSGELRVGGTLVIGRDGNVSADVVTVDALILGTYVGNLRASGSIEIAATGRVSGTLESDELVIAKGGIFTGSVARPEAITPQVQAQPQAGARRAAQGADASEARADDDDFAILPATPVQAPRARRARADATVPVVAQLADAPEPAIPQLIDLDADGQDDVGAPIATQATPTLRSITLS